MYIMYTSRYHRIMDRIASGEARAKFRELLNEVEVRGEHVEIHRRGITAAVVVPAAWYERAKAALEQVSKTREEQGR